MRKITQRQGYGPCLNECVVGVVESAISSGRCFDGQKLRTGDVVVCEKRNGLDFGALGLSNSLGHNWIAS